MWSDRRITSLFHAVQFCQMVSFVSETCPISDNSIFKKSIHASDLTVQAVHSSPVNSYHLEQLSSHWGEEIIQVWMKYKIEKTNKNTYSGRVAWHFMVSTFLVCSHFIKPTVQYGLRESQRNCEHIHRQRNWQDTKCDQWELVWWLVGQNDSDTHWANTGQAY